MAIHLNNPEIQAKIDRHAEQTGSSADQLVEEVMAQYFKEYEELIQLAETRYEELQSGAVQAIPGEEAMRMLRAKIAARQNRPA